MKSVVHGLLIANQVTHGNLIANNMKIQSDLNATRLLSEHRLKSVKHEMKRQFSWDWSENQSESKESAG